MLSHKGQFCLVHVAQFQKLCVTRPQHAFNRPDAAAGEMGDAAEVLTALYEKLATAAERAGQAKLLEQNFGMQIKVSTMPTEC